MLIIRFPTGLYINKLPIDPEDSGSITWTISTEKPSRPTTILQQYPSALQLSTLTPSSLTSQEARKLYGTLLVTVTKSKTSTGLSNTIRYEVGKILEQNDISIAFDNTLVPKDVEIQHANNIYDLKSLGLTDEEIALLESESNTKSDEIREELTEVTTQLDVVRNAIFENQKQISEAQSSINALNLTTLDSIKEKLEQKLSELQGLNTQLRTQENELETEALSLRNQLLAISVLVR